MKNSWAHLDSQGQSLPPGLDFPSFQVFRAIRFYGAHFSSVSTQRVTIYVSPLSQKCRILELMSCLLAGPEQQHRSEQEPSGRTGLESSGGSAQGPRRSLISGLVEEFIFPGFRALDHKIQQAVIQL